MGKRRTKSQKVTARREYQYQFIEAVEEKLDRNPQISRVPKITALTLYGYEPRLIRLDIIKTMVVSGIILIIEIGLYRFWR